MPIIVTENENWFLDFVESPEVKKERERFYKEMCERADAGEYCFVCGWRRMDTEGGPGYGIGVCEKCI